jgi:hypothetical protein
MPLRSGGKAQAGHFESEVCAGHKVLGGFLRVSILLSRLGTLIDRLHREIAPH